MWNLFATYFKVLRYGEPGRRFRDFREYERTHGLIGHPAARIAVFVVGLSLIVVGLAIGWLPGPGGFLAIIGLALIAREVPGVASILDRCELIIRYVWRRFRSWPMPLQLATYVAVTAVSLSAIWMSYTYLWS